MRFAFPDENVVAAVRKFSAVPVDGGQAGVCRDDRPAGLRREVRERGAEAGGRHKDGVDELASVDGVVVDLL